MSVIFGNERNSKGEGYMLFFHLMCVNCGAAVASGWWPVRQSLLFCKVAHFFVNDLGDVGDCLDKQASRSF